MISIKKASLILGIVCTFSSSFPSYAEISKQSSDIAKRLVAMKDMAVKDSTGDTALHFAYTLEGYLAQPNFKLFFEWLKLSAVRGNNDALNQVGLHYEYGVGIKQNVDLAVEYYDHIKVSNNNLIRVKNRAVTRSLCHKPSFSRQTNALLDNRPTTLIGTVFVCLNRQSITKLFSSKGSKKLVTNQFTDTYEGNEKLYFSKRIYTDYSASGALLNVRFYISKVDINDVLYEMRELYGKEEPNYGVEAIRGKEWVWHRTDGIDITLIKDGESSMLTMADISSDFVNRRQEVYPTQTIDVTPVKQ